MNILLFSMPDSFEHMPPIAIRMPNGALTSLAGNIDPHHRAAAADLLLGIEAPPAASAGAMQQFFGRRRSALLRTGNRKSSPSQRWGRSASRPE